tara:strand:- start:332 stop:523 length:192 start_codon:yes stop_codon:yes gene_type:complete
MKINSIPALRKLITSVIFDQQRQIRTMGYQTGRTFNKLNKLQNQYKDLTGTTLYLFEGNIKER